MMAGTQSLAPFRGRGKCSVAARERGDRASHMALAAPSPLSPTPLPLKGARGFTPDPEELVP